MNITNVTKEYDKCPNCQTILLHSDVMWYNATEEDLYCPKCFEVWRFIEK